MQYRKNLDLQRKARQRFLEILVDGSDDPVSSATAPLDKEHLAYPFSLPLWNPDQVLAEICGPSVFGHAHLRWLNSKAEVWFFEMLRSWASLERRSSSQ